MNSRMTALGLALLTVMSMPSRARETPSLDCLLEPNRVIDLSSSIRGVIAAIDVDRGDLVEEGQVVARLDSSVEQAALELARARARANAQVRAEQISTEFAKRRSERVGTLYGQSAISGDQFDESKTSARLRELQLQQARENQLLAQLEERQAEELLKRYTVRSPVRGVVVHRYLSTGESAEDRPILRVAELQTLRAEAIIPVSEFGTVKVGQRAVIVPEAPINGHYVGTVAVVDRVADAASGTFRARVSLPNPDYALPSGLRCSVRFLQPGESVAQNIPAPPASRPQPRTVLPGRRTRSPPPTAAVSPLAVPRSAAAATAGPSR